MEMLEDRTLLSATGWETGTVPEEIVSGSDSIQSPVIVNNFDRAESLDVAQSAPVSSEAAAVEVYTVSESKAFPVSGTASLSITNAKLTEETYEAGDKLTIDLTTTTGNAFHQTQLRVWHSADGVSAKDIYVENRGVSGEVSWDYDILESDIGSYLFFEVGYTFENDADHIVYVTSAVTVTKVIAGNIDSVKINSNTSASNLVYYSATGSSILSAALTPEKATASYQWFRDGTAIQGATGVSYQVSLPDVGSKISVTATGTGNWIGTASAEMEGKVQGLITSVALSSYNPTAGETLSVSCISTAAAGSVSYDWYALPTKNSELKNTYLIQTGGETTFTLTEEQVGYFIYVQAVGTGNWTTLKTISTVSEKVTGNFTAQFSESTEELELGNTLTVNLFDRNDNLITDPNSKASFKWYRGTTLITNAADSYQYTVQAADVGSVLSVKITGISGWTAKTTSLTTSSSATGTIDKVEIVYDGTIKENTKLQTTVTPNGGDYTYQWYYSTAQTDDPSVVWTKIDGQTRSYFTLVNTYLNKYLKVEVTGNGWVNIVSATQSAYVTPSLQTAAFEPSDLKVGDTVKAIVIDSNSSSISDFTGMKFVWSYGTSSSPTGVFNVYKTVYGTNEIVLDAGDTYLANKYLRVEVTCESSTGYHGSVYAILNNPIASRSSSASASEAAVKDSQPILTAKFSKLEFDSILIIDASVRSDNGELASEWTIHWGDEEENGAGEIIQGGTFSVRTIHYYEKSGTYEIILTVNNSDNTWGKYSYHIGSYTVTKSTEIEFEEKTDITSQIKDNSGRELSELEWNVSESAASVSKENASVLLLESESAKEISMDSPLTEIDLATSDLLDGNSGFCGSDVSELSLAALRNETLNGRRRGVLLLDLLNESNKKDDRIFETIVKSSPSTFLNGENDQNFFENLLDEQA